MVRDGTRLRGLGQGHRRAFRGRLTHNVENFFEALAKAGVQAIPVAYLCNRLPEVLYSRTFTVLAGSFPPDLTGLRGPAQYELPRLEWASWLIEITHPDDLPRRPSFGDCTIQHAVYREPVERANVSASIRYTSDDYWVVMRGEGLRTPGSPGHAQYVGNAQLLCQRKEFTGPQFSAGDDYIWKVASGRDSRFGNPETWIRAGINHHLVFGARQIQSVVSARSLGFGPHVNLGRPRH